MILAVLNNNELLYEVVAWLVCIVIIIIVILVLIWSVGEIAKFLSRKKDQ